MTVNQTLFEIKVTESNKNREYWISRQWLSDRRSDVTSADILAVPWENFREGDAALYPQGTGEFINLLKRHSLNVDIAIDEQHYHEILLHSKLYRLPTLVVTLVALPALAGIIANLVTELMTGSPADDRVKFNVIVQGIHGKCISIEYEGPANRLAESLVSEASRCLPSEPQIKQ